MRRYEVFITDGNWNTRRYMSTSRNAMALLQKYGTVGSVCRVYYNMKPVSGANWNQECGMYRVAV